MRVTCGRSPVRRGTEAWGRPPSLAGVLMGAPGGTCPAWPHLASDPGRRPRRDQDLLTNKTLIKNDPYHLDTEIWFQVWFNPGLGFNSPYIKGKLAGVEDRCVASRLDQQVTRELYQPIRGYACNSVCLSSLMQTKDTWGPILPPAQLSFYTDACRC